MKTINKILLLSSTVLLGVLLYPSMGYSQNQITLSASPLVHENEDTTSFTTTLLISKPAAVVFAGINNVRGWWSEEIEGNTTQLNSEFNYHFEDVHRCELQIIEMVPGKKVVWLVKKNYFKFTKDKSEWTGTKIIFELEEKDGKTRLRFTHQGLVPEYECYTVCRPAWTRYINQSLRDLILTGKGQPNGAGKPQTADEQKLGSGN